MLTTPALPTPLQRLTPLSTSALRDLHTSAKTFPIPFRLGNELALAKNVSPEVAHLGCCSHLRWFTGGDFAAPYCWHGVDAHTCKGIRKGLAATIGLAMCRYSVESFSKRLTGVLFRNAWQVSYEFEYPAGILEKKLKIYHWFVLCNFRFLNVTRYHS
jgi:hypothetical protein